ncbi:hypothetical protein [Geobacter sp.]|uniref:hypothetical protein n=1 Tax=Geobacter sp. TaxID=46610 RepID=UPI001ACC0C7B|nr:hypothetical protein [Geobacter sp.]CAG0987338.1 hypothetical protein GEOBC_02173 [Geobacteraceae bacterium]
MKKAKRTTRFAFFMHSQLAGNTTAMKNQYLKLTNLADFPIIQPVWRISIQSFRGG